MLFVLLLATAAVWSSALGARCAHTKTCYCPDSETLFCSGIGYITHDMLINALGTSSVKLIDIRSRTITTELLRDIEKSFTDLYLLDIRDIDCSLDMYNFVYNDHLFTILSDCLRDDNFTRPYSSQPDLGIVTNTNTDTSMSTVTETSTTKQMSSTLPRLTRKVRLNLKSYNVTRPSTYSMTASSTTVNYNMSSSTNVLTLPQLNSDYFKGPFLYVSICILLVGSLWTFLLTIQCMLTLCTKIANGCEYYAFVCCNKCKCVKQMFKSSQENISMQNIESSAGADVNVALTCIENESADCDNTSLAPETLSGAHVNEYDSLFAFRNSDERSACMVTGTTASTSSVYIQTHVNNFDESEVNGKKCERKRVVKK